MLENLETTKFYGERNENKPYPNSPIQGLFYIREF